MDDKFEEIKRYAKERFEEIENQVGVTHDQMSGMRQTLDRIEEKIDTVTAQRREVIGALETIKEKMERGGVSNGYRKRQSKRA